MCDITLFIGNFNEKQQKNKISLKTMQILL